MKSPISAQLSSLSLGDKFKPKNEIYFRCFIGILTPIQQKGPMGLKPVPNVCKLQELRRSAEGVVYIHYVGVLIQWKSTNFTCKVTILKERTNYISKGVLTVFIAGVKNSTIYSLHNFTLAG